MTGPGPNRPRPAALHGPINHRDASSNSGSHWKNTPTPISVPTNEHRPRRPHDTPFYFSNTLSRPGNPNVRQTILAKPPSAGFAIEPSARKRQKLDHNVSSGLTSNGVPSSSLRGPASSSNTSESDIQLVEQRRRNNRSDPVPNDAEIICIGTSSDNLGERVPRVVDSSPDPILLIPPAPHVFETYPTKNNLSESNKGKERAKEAPELIVEGSEGSEEIEQYSSPAHTSRPPSSKKSPGIPRNIVRDLKARYENTSVSAPLPAAIRQPIGRTVRVDLIKGGIVGQMRKRDEGALGNQSSTDRVGMSSSNFLNSARPKERIQVLPLEACCIGHHLYRYSDATPLKLAYEFARQRIKITWNSPLVDIEFKLDRNVRSTMIANDSEGPLKEDVVVQFITAEGQDWKGVEHKFKGFVGGSDRGRGALTFLFSTRDRSVSATDYQRFVTGVRKAFKESAVEIMSPSKGRSIWEFAVRFADMFEQTQSRQNEDRSESTVGEPSIVVQSATSHPSTSVKARTPCPDSKPPSGDSGPSVLQRRSLRQAAIRSSRFSPSPPPLAQLEPDEVILMYPPTGTGALSVMHSDLRRLQPEEYLNDTLIEFGLKLWLNDLRGKNPALADQIHVFSSFFYKKLNNKKNPADGYQSVRKWTSKVDLFTKKYVIVPINENIHWYLAVIYEPGHILEPPLPPSHNPNARLTRKRKRAQERVEANVEAAAISEPAPTGVSLERSHFSQTPEAEQEANTSSMNATRATTPSTTRSGEMVVNNSCPLAVGSEPVSATSSEIQIRDLSPRFNLLYPSDYVDAAAEMSVTDVAPNAMRGIAKVPNSPRSTPLLTVPAGQFYGSTSITGEAPLDKEDSGEDQEQEAEVDNMLAITHPSSGDWPAQTYIFTLDSLGTRHPQAIKVLKQYLVWEAKDKRNFDEVRNAVGKQVQVPVQPNSWDCGIYLLQFVKVFMSSPSEFFEQIISTRGIMPSTERRKMWQDHEIPQFRDYLKSRIKKLSDEWKAEKTVEVNKRRNGVEVEVLTSESEVDIVEDMPNTKSTPVPRQKRLATRLRG